MRCYNNIHVLISVTLHRRDIMILRTSTMSGLILHSIIIIHIYVSYTSKIGFGANGQGVSDKATE